MKSNFKIFIVTILILSTLLTACGNLNNAKPTDVTAVSETNESGSSTSNLSDDKKGNVLFIGGQAPTGAFNPIFSSGMYDMAMNALMFLRLLNITDDGVVTEDGSLSAKMPSFSEDHKIMTLHLRDDVKWWDGTPFTADDVKFTFESTMDPSYGGSGFNASVQVILGAQDVNSGTAKEAEGIRVIDDHTLEIEVSEAYANTIWELAISPIPRHYYTSDSIPDMQSKNDSPMGNGPFKLVHHESEQYVEFEANDNFVYGRPKLDGIIYRNIPDTDKLSEIKLETVDVVQMSNNKDNYSQVEAGEFPNATLINNMNNGYCYIAFNFSQPTIQDKNVRQALTYGYEREGLVKSFYGEDGGAVAHTGLSPVSWAYPDENKLNKYEYNPEKAIELLKKSGYELNSDGYMEKDGEELSLKWVTANSELSTKMTALAVQNWKTIGVRLDVQLMDFNSLIALLDDLGNKDAWDMYNLCWGVGQDPDMSEFYHSKGSQNYNFYSNSELDDLMIQAKNEFDQEKRKELYQEICLKFNDDLPYIFTFVRRDPWLINNRVKNFRQTELVHWFYNKPWEIEIVNN